MPLSLSSHRRARGHFASEAREPSPFARAVRP